MYSLHHKSKKIYDLIFDLLKENEELRNSDKKLIWRVWEKLDLADTWDHQISKENFMMAPSTESIRRCRQKIQETHPDLRSSKKVQELKDKKESTKSAFVYREEISFSESVKEQMTFI